MSEVYELHPGTEPSIDYRGSKVGVRRFHVTGIRPQSVTPGLVGTNGTLPNFFDPHPTIAGMLVNEVLPRDLNGTDCVVDVRYGSHNQWKQPRPLPDITDATFASWSITPSRERIAVPIAVKGPMEFPIAGTTPVIKQVWQRVDFSLIQTQAVVQWRGTLQAFDPTMWGPIFDRDNELHRIGGRYYRFEAGEIEQVEAAAWTVRYSWVYDGGTKRPAEWDVPTPNVVYPPTVATISSIPYVREPYRELGIKASDNIETTPPTWYQTDLYRKVDNGWQTLPGNPV